MQTIKHVHLLRNSVVLQDLKTASWECSVPLVATVSRLSHQQDTCLKYQYLSFDLVVSKAKMLEVGGRIGLD